MSAALTHNSYGKSHVRLTKVIRDGSHHDLIELSANILLEGDFADSYITGNNSKIVATDSMKNTVYVLAKENSFDNIETFAIQLAKHFTKTYSQVDAATIEIEQTGWQRIAVDGKLHEHAFVAAGSDRRTCRAKIEKKSGKLKLIGGISGLLVLKTTASEFWGFVEDRYRTLKDTKDRIFATSVDASWVYSDERTDFNAAYNSVRAALLKIFATHHSLAVQQTLLAMGESALTACGAIRSIKLTMPNQHRIPVNLQPFNLENSNEIFVPMDEPFGLITGVVERE
jgi:urate oxidase